MIVFLICWLMAFFYVFSIGEISYVKGEVFGEINWPDSHEILIFLMCFAFLWMMAFLMSHNVLNIAFMSTSWYF